MVSNWIKRSRVAPTSRPTSQCHEPYAPISDLHSSHAFSKPLSSLHYNCKSLSFVSLEAGALSFIGTPSLSRTIRIVGPDQHPGVVGKSKQVSTVPASLRNGVHLPAIWAPGTPLVRSLALRFFHWISLRTQ